MAYEKTYPLYLRQKTQVKTPGDDSNYGPSPTAHQLPQAKGRPPQEKITIGRKGNENSLISLRPKENNTPKSIKSNHLLKERKLGVEVTGDPSGHRRRKGAMGIWGNGSRGDQSKKHT